MMAKRSGSARSGAGVDSNEFDVTLKYEARIVTEHLGTHKYSRVTHAITELVMNGFDAGARSVFVETRRNELDLVAGLVVTDDGAGMSRIELTERFGTVGVRSSITTKTGRFGVGRWAVYRIGRISDWVTTAREEDASKWRYSFTLNSDDPGHFRVHRQAVPGDEPTGTRVEVSELERADLSDGTLVWELAVQLCGYLLRNPSRRLYVNQTPVAIEMLIQAAENEELTVEGVDGDPPQLATVRHLLFKSISRSHFKEHILFTAQGLAVSAVRLEDPPSPQYVAVVESSYLDEMVTANRAAFLEMDQTFGRLRDAVEESVKQYRRRTAEAQSVTFIERARSKEFYPYRAVAKDGLVSVQQHVYDATLEAIHRISNLEALKPQHQRVIYGLLDRALTNGDVLHVLGELATLNDSEMAKLKATLERTTIRALLNLAAQVQQRLDFLQMLRELVYGADASVVKERAQLHKYLEAHPWLFGPQYHLATSDKAFRTVIARQREEANLPPADEEELAKIQDIDRIPDLFFCARREYASPEGLRRSNLLVEIKRPGVDLGNTELAQLHRYANVILDSSESNDQRHHCDVFLISGGIKREIRRLARQEGKPAGQVADLGGVKCWVRSWSEIIEDAENEMHLVREHLRVKSLDVTAREYFEAEFPSVLFPPSAVGAG